MSDREVIRRRLVARIDHPLIVSLRGLQWRCIQECQCTGCVTWWTMMAKVSDYLDHVESITKLDTHIRRASPVQLPDGVNEAVVEVPPPIGPGNFR